MEYYIRMSLRQWLAMFAFYAMYVFLGASIFYTIEHNLETERRAAQLQERIDMNDLLTTYTSPNDIELQNKILDQVSDYCGRKVTNHTLDEHVDPYVWNFFHAFYFSFTTCTTVGYGNISPSTSLGRIILCFYALFGIPISCFFIASVAHFFAATYVRLHKQYMEYKHANTKNYVPPAVGFAGKICMYLTPGLVIFIFVPAILFSYFEEWDYVRSVYYSFVTLSTVGYGDLVPTFQSHQEREFHLYFLAYEIFIIFWNIAGLGYVLMLINFVAKAMKSKRVAKWEHKISQNIKATEHLVRQEVSKDLNFLRRLLNEVNLLKVKPVYNDVSSKRQSIFLPRSSSCPDLSLYHYKNTGRSVLGRSYSLAPDSTPISLRMGSTNLHKTQSDSDLYHIDRQKTFRNSTNSRGEDDLITKVVSALGSIRQQDEIDRSGSEMGINGFSDSQILSSEKSYSAWSLHRCDAELHASRASSLSNFNQLTWNGRNSNEIRATTDATVSSRPNVFNRSVSLHIPDDEDNKDLQNVVNKEALNRMLKKPRVRLLSEQSKRNSVVFSETEKRNAKRDSIISLPREYISSTSRGRDSIISILDAPIHGTKSELLENTSIADLIRALEVVHTSAVYENGPVNASPKMKSHLSQMVNSRRGSLRPIPGYTTVFSSSDNKEHMRKISTQSTPNPSSFSRHLSLLPHYPPPQYTTTVALKPTVHRSSIRLANTSPERNNPSIPPSILLQKKLPHGPSPLARNT
ncbi:open rectifier potassium channel protein 1-like [Bradysia coprophila]|uniref:open rectifier potassium channel protein 1-like n=1 Tax=Bradysia coprophila TaxID=38358 RepID=UPI00187DD2DD|nr:open rectifier potassium channel protein 1-like [Bradysia coprophila]